MNINFIVILMASLAMLGTMAIFRWKAHIEDTKIIIKGVSKEILKFRSDFATDYNEIQQNPDPLELVLSIIRSAIKVKKDEIKPFEKKQSLNNREKQCFETLKLQFGILNGYKKSLEIYENGALVISRLFNWPFYFSCFVLSILFLFTFFIDIKILNPLVSSVLCITLPLISIILNLLCFSWLFNFKVHSH